MNTNVANKQIELIDESTNWAVDLWRTWINERLNDRLEEYRRVSSDGEKIGRDRLISDLRSNHENSKAYHGREILELLQNAADQYDVIPVDVFIEVRPDGLIFANSGISFSAGGMKSVFTSHLSPKKKRKGMIGNKGLGFRSILNWTDSPKILSGNAAISFSRSFSQSCIREIELLDEAVEGPIVLSFPQIISEGDEESKTDIMLAAWNLKRNYSTVLVLPFQTEANCIDVLKQIESLHHSILLFVDGLKRVEFSGLGLNKVIEMQASLGKDCDTVIIETIGGVETIHRWFIRCDSGTIQLNGVADNFDYDVRVALPRNKASKSKMPKLLHSYFPTKVGLPLPALCHATLNLKPDRDGLIHDDQCNKKVLGKLGDILVGSIVDYLKEEKNDIGIDALLAAGEIQSEDLRDFKQQIQDALRAIQIVPCIDGELKSIQIARILHGNPKSWVPLDTFGIVADAINESECSRLEKIGVKKLSREDFLHLLNNLKTEPSIRNRFLDGLLSSEKNVIYHSPRCLLDSKGNVPDDKCVLVYRRSGTHLNWPEWSNVRYLHPDLNANNRFNSEKFKASELKLFNLHESANVDVCAAVVKSGNELVLENFEKSENVYWGIIQFLYAFWKTRRSGKIQEWPKQSVYIPTDKGWIDSSDAYFGQGFGISGQIMSVIFSNRSEVLAVYKDEYTSIFDSREELMLFFQWVNVAKWPRTVSHEYQIKQHSDYKKNLIEKSFVFPFKYGDVEYSNRSHLHDWNVNLRKIQSVDSLSEIIKSSYVAIVLWVAHDERFENWQRNSSDCAEVWIKSGNMRNDRRYSASFPSYVLWLLKHKEWLVDGNGSDSKLHSSIGSVCLKDKELRKAFRNVMFPIDVDLIKYYGDDCDINLARDDAFVAYRRLGVVTEKYRIPAEYCLDALLELNTDNDSDGKIARSVYGLLLSADLVNPIIPKLKMEKWKKEGKILSACNGEVGFYPVAEVVRVDHNKFPKCITEMVRVAQIPVVSEKNALNRLWIKTLSSSDFEFGEVNAGNIANFCSMEDRFDRSKRFVAYYRRKISKDDIGISDYFDLSVKMYDSINVEIKASGEDNYQWHSLDSYSSIALRGFLYVVAPKDSTLLRLSLSIGSSVVVLFKLHSDDFVHKFLMCENDDERISLLCSMLPNYERSEILSDFENHMDDLCDSSEHHGYEDVEMENSYSNSDASNTNAIDPDSVKNTSSENTNAGNRNGRAPHFRSPPAPGETKTPNRSSQEIGLEGEMLALEWEKLQKRFPVDVSNLVGSGCDIISFDNERDFLRFKELNDSPNDANEILTFMNDPKSNISRYIEAKRSIVNLGPKQVELASLMLEKFYVYKFSECADNEWEVYILCNPLSHPSIRAKNVILNHGREIPWMSYSFNQFPKTN